MKNCKIIEGKDFYDDEFLEVLFLVCDINIFIKVLILFFFIILY